MVNGYIQLFDYQLHPCSLNIYRTYLYGAIGICVIGPNVLVAGQDRIDILDRNYQLQSSVDLVKFCPRWICGSKSGNILVTVSNGFLILDSGGNMIKHVIINYLFDYLTVPDGICVNSRDEIYIVDSNGCSILVFDQQGNFLRKFGHRGKDYYGFTNPCEICIDSCDNIYVSDKDQKRIYIFDPNELQIQQIPTSVVPCGLCVIDRMLFVTSIEGVIKKYIN